MDVDLFVVQFAFNVITPKLSMVAPYKLNAEPSFPIPSPELATPVMEESMFQPTDADEPNAVKLVPLRNKNHNG